MKYTNFFVSEFAPYHFGEGSHNFLYQRGDNRIRTNFVRRHILTIFREF